MAHHVRASSMTRALPCLVACLLGGCDLFMKLQEWPEPDAPGIAGPWLQVAVGEGFTCAVDTDKLLWCWGENDNHELGTGANVAEIDAPTNLAGMHWLEVAAGSHHACA